MCIALQNLLLRQLQARGWRLIAESRLLGKV
jgi:hypothetical protein